MTNITAANNLFEIGLALNQSSGMLFFLLAVFILFFVYLAVFKKQNFKPVLVGGSFGISVVSILLFVLGYISHEFIIIPIVLFTGSIIIFYFVQKN